MRWSRPTLVVESTNVVSDHHVGVCNNMTTKQHHKDRKGKNKKKKHTGMLTVALTVKPQHFRKHNISENTAYLLCNISENTIF